MPHADRDGLTSELTDARADPQELYARTLDSRKAALAHAAARYVKFGNVRIVVLVLGTVLTYVVAFEHGLLSPLWLLLPLAAFSWIGIQLNRSAKARMRFGRAAAYYERALNRLDGRWGRTGPATGEAYRDDAHLYARDLDLFGPRSLFDLLNGTTTEVGERTLADWLSAPAPAAEIIARQEAVRELAPRNDLREDLAVLGERSRTAVHDKRLAEWGERQPVLGRATPVWAWPLSAAGFLGGIALLILGGAYIHVFHLSGAASAALQIYVLVAFAVCASVNRRFRARTATILKEAERAAPDLEILSGVLGRIETESFHGPRLAALRAALDVDGVPPSKRIAQLDRLMNLVDSRDHLFVRLAAPFVLWDLHVAYALEHWRRVSGAALRRWLVAVGEVEALLSLAGYAYDHPDAVFPEITSGAVRFDAHGLGHPLLPAATVVRNDVSLGDGTRVLVVSGSNMSGKSTLLRAVGVNAVLAQCGAPVRATRLAIAAPLEVGASILVEDSLQDGISRFYAEILRLGAIMRHAAERPVLFLIDELLQGTNSHDRAIGAEAIVRGLMARGAIGLLTTHDLALAHVADTISGGANVHFADEFRDGVLHFDYRMRPGVVRHSNALELMRSVGLRV